MTAISSALAATDSSPGADRAVRRAASLVSSLGGEINKNEQ